MTLDERDFAVLLHTTLTEWAAEAPVGATPWREPAPARRPARRRWRVAVATATVAVVAVAGYAVRVGERGGQYLVPGREQMLSAEIPVGDRPGVRVIAAGDGALFVTSENDKRLYRVDPVTNRVTANVELGPEDSVIVMAGSVWVMPYDPPRLVRLDPVTLAVTATLPLPGETRNLVAAGGWIWVGMRDGRLLRIDPATAAVAGTALFGRTPRFAAFGGAGFWMTADDGTVSELDPRTGEIRAVVDIGGEPRAVAVSGDAVWVNDTGHDEVVRIDPVRRGVVARVPVGLFPHGLAVDGTSVWVTNFDDGTLDRIDATTDTVAAEVPIGFRPGSVAVYDGSVWVAVHREARVVRLDPATVSSLAQRPIDLDARDVDVGGRTIHLRCMGSGSPTVVLEADEFSWSGEWLFVQYGLQRTTRVCAYDRAGFGRSDAGPRPRTAAGIARDLHDALASAAIPGPYVLAGSGHGGLYSRMYAATYPAEVRGLVLVDAISPAFVDEVLPLLTAEQRAGIEQSYRDDPELQGQRERFAEVAATGDLGTLPLVVITHGEHVGPLGAAAEALWQRQQREQVALSTRGRLVVAEVVRSIPLDDPRVVVDALVALLGR